MVALQKGNQPEARRLLIQALEENPEDERFWLWLSWVAETEEEQMKCLRKLYEIDPEHPVARRFFAEPSSEPQGPLPVEAILPSRPSSQTKQPPAPAPNKPVPPTAPAAAPPPPASPPAPPQPAEAESRAEDGAEEARPTPPPAVAGEEPAPATAADGEQKEPLVSVEVEETSPTSNGVPSDEAHSWRHGEPLPVPPASPAAMAETRPEPGPGEGMGRSAAARHLRNIPGVSFFPEDEEEDEADSLAYTLTLPDRADIQRFLRRWGLVLVGFLIVLLVFVMSVWNIINHSPIYVPSPPDAAPAAILTHPVLL